MYEKETIIDKLGRLISIAGNIILMNLMFLVACIPVVTIGQAWAGLLSAVRYNIRGEKWFDGFKAGFKKRFLRGTIAWCVMLAVDIFFLRDVLIYFRAVQVDSGATVPFVAACLMFALATMVTMSIQLLNVYVPTPTGSWLRNGVDMVFKVPLELLVAAALFWAPVLMFEMWFDGFIFAVMLLITAYFGLIAAGITMLMKNALIHYLVEARTAGILLAEEGRMGGTEEQEEK